MQTTALAAMPYVREQTRLADMLDRSDAAIDTAMRATGRFLRKAFSRKRKPAKPPKGYNRELQEAVRSVLWSLNGGPEPPSTLAAARMTVEKIYL